MTGKEYVAGLVCTNYGTITNSYATGNVNGSKYVGGLVGENDSTIINSYSTGRVSGTSYVGGLVGRSYRGITTKSFWDIETSGQSTSAGGIGITSVEMKQLSTFSSWNNTTQNTITNSGGNGAIWRIYEGYTAPLLASFQTPLTYGNVVRFLMGNLKGVQ